MVMALVIKKRQTINMGKKSLWAKVSNEKIPHRTKVLLTQAFLKHHLVSLELNFGI